MDWPVRPKKSDTKAQLLEYIELLNAELERDAAHRAPPEYGKSELDVNRI